MFFSGIIRRKIASLLQPWLREEPQLELKLGFLRSHGIAKNLRFDASSLNQLLDESSRFSFKDFTVEQLVIQISSWSIPAFTVEIRGIHVTLSVGEPLEEGHSRARKSADSFSKNMKKILSVIDPEGTALHGVLERITLTTPSRNRCMTSVLNIILEQCRLQMHDIHLQLQFPSLNDSLACSLEIEELCAESPYLKHGLFLSELISAVVVPVKESSLTLDCRGFNIKMKKREHVNCVLSSTDLFACILLKDLQLLDFKLCVPELSFLLSPLDFHIILAFGERPPNESKYVRSGRQLWGLAASRIGYLISAPDFSFYKIVGVVCLWLQYVKAYEHLLLLVGYAAENVLKQSVIKMFEDNKFSRSVKQQWKVISGVEKELPAEAIAQARQIARYRAALNAQHAEDRYSESQVNGHFKFFLRILLVLAFIWKTMCSVFQPLRKLFFLRKLLAEYPEIVNVSDDSCPKHCYILSLGKLSITVYPINAVQHHTSKISESHGRISNLDLLSICISVDALSLIYMEDIGRQSFSVACGQLKVISSSVAGSPIMKHSSKNFISSLKGHWTGRANVPNTIMWGEPAKMFLPSENNGIGTTNHAEGVCVSFLENLLGEMWLGWKRSCIKFEESELPYFESPCILCEIQSSFMIPDLMSQAIGFWRCSLTVGKLNFNLDYLSMLSIIVLIGQVEHALCQVKNSQSAVAFSHSPRTIKDLPGITRDCRLESCTHGMEMTLLRVVPEKHIQLAVHIAGPHIRISLRKEQFQGGQGDEDHIVTQDDFHIQFDIHDIEVAVWPTSKSDLASMNGCLGLDGAEPEYLGLKEHQIIDIPKPDNGNYISKGQIPLGFYLRVNGLNAYYQVSEENQPSEIFVLKPIFVQLSTFRDYLHSFGEAVVAISAGVCGIAAGFTASLYMDELFIFFQAVVSLYAAASYAFSSLDLVGRALCEDSIKQEMASVVTENVKTTAKGACLILKSFLFVFTGTFHFKSVDIILHKFRESKNMDRCIKTVDALCRKGLAELDVPDCGIWISVHKACVRISCEEEKLCVLTDFSELQSSIFRYQSLKGENSYSSELRNLLPESMDCLCEASLSNCKFTLWMGSHQNVKVSSPGHASSILDDSTSSRKSSCTLDNSPSKILTKSPSVESFSFEQKLGFSYILGLDASPWLVINIVLGEIFMASCSMKNVLHGAHQPNELLSSLSVGKDFQTISWGIQGGFVFLEIPALAVFVRCFASYLRCISNFLSNIPPLKKEVDDAKLFVNVVGLNDHSIDTREMLNTPQQTKWELLESSILNLSQFSLVLVTKDESGGVREFVLEADFRLNLKLVNKRRFLFDLSRLSILSQMLDESGGNESQSPHFSSVKTIDLSSHVVSGDPITACHQVDSFHSVADHASCSSDPASRRESSMNFASGAYRLSHQNYILKQLKAFISIENSVPGEEYGPVCSNQVWVGSGSVSGFDVILSLSEVQMILSISVSVSGIFGKDTASGVKEKPWSSKQELDKTLEETVPDGSIVAIQDVHQHMYFTVERVDNNYNLVGTIHYSLVGERALFRVKYHNQRIWNFPIMWFSLTSLYAKNDSGEPLRLNYHSGSGFVDISSTNDGGWALWRALPCKPKSYEGVVDWEPFNRLSKNTFYLVNKKNDSAVAFADGVPEFVKKPGNPFKLKVFHDLSLDRNVVNNNNNSLEAPATNLQHNLHMDKERISAENRTLPQIDIAIDKVTLTVVHELPNTEDKFPLMQGCICSVQLIVQTLSNKARVMSTLRAMLCYFDAQNNLWRELVDLAEVCIFFRIHFQIQGSESVFHGVPVHLYFKIKEFNISLTELSMDILLFVIGKLNLAGPYSVKTSTILANCCKVENQSGLSLLCRFKDEQDVTIARNQSASIFLRHSAVADQPLKNAAFVSIQLATPGAFATSPIHLSVLEAQALAWRTRIVSLKDSRSYPGPFVVVDVPRKMEDGLSVVVSPLIRVHNGTKFSMELRFQRPQQKEEESASVLLKAGDTIDDSMAAFDAINLSGGLRKALMSLSVGNFVFSFRPYIAEVFINSEESNSVEWSDDLKGGKAVSLSGIFDKLSYKVRKAFSVGSVKCCFSTAHCSLKFEKAHVADVHFLIQSIGREVPVMQPGKFGDLPESRNSPIALQEQREIFLLPTVRVSNFLQSEIHVLLNETDECNTTGYHKIGNEATIPRGSTADLYANPALIYFTVALTAFSSRCKPVNSGEWVKKLQKQKTNKHYLDIDLNFGGGKYFASLRLSRGHGGILEAAIFTSYTLKNDTDFPLLFTSNHRHISRDEVEKFDSSIPTELGLYLPPFSSSSWFLKSNRLHLKLLGGKEYDTLLDLDALAGLAELSLQTEEGYGFKRTTKLGVSLGPSLANVILTSQTVTIVPRHVIFNESEEIVIVRQCYLEDEMEGVISVNSKQRVMLQLRNEASKRREISLFENFIRKRRHTNDEALIFIQFRLNEAGVGWSGPVCINSLGRFFLKFRRSLDIPVLQSNQVTAQDNNLREFAAVNVVEEGSTLVLHFHRPLSMNMPYRIENLLHVASITYYQKESLEREILCPESSVDYVWDDLTLPHKLVVQINEMQLLREINLDKVRKWKPFFNFRQLKGLASHLLLDKKPRNQKRGNLGESSSAETVKVGYEVYADGPTRVLRISEFPDRSKREPIFQSCAKIELRISYTNIHLLEHGRQDADTDKPSVYTPIIVARLGKLTLDSVFTDQHKYNQISIQSLTVDQKWVGAPFAAVLRRPQMHSDTNDILQIVFVLLSTSSNVKQVKYSSVLLQPIDLNLDEETLMRLVPFWRKSLNDSNTQSRQFYFDHFEIHPIKVIASFLPGDSYASYSSAQETLRSLLHSVIKIPTVKNIVVELNGVLVTHALITMRELFIKCAQHYSWYAMRAIYIAKGSKFLPPAFASIFDDLASSSLDVFFDPSHGLTNLPGLTLGTFKLISRCIDGKGFLGTKRYLGDLGKTLRTAGSNVLFAAVTEISDSVLKGAETSGFNGVVNGFHQGILKLAMEPSLLGTAFMEGGPDRKIKLDRSPGVDELS
ncbi:uncharacterized protein LOC131163647 isoform X2 [Malania oleifera]|uniref:uncharacterized protein LOC131163647 isoform X2 n=1 Tax=Malania oleifera TaxID=397392 RepID=UPI0025ADCDD7|nr:uncharacterized protein LOC131163647 isoform X2 [Malania oleifera]